MQTPEEKISAIEKEIRETPYHKGTQHHIGRLRARIARFKEEIIQAKTKSKGGSPPAGGFAQRKYGDATVVLVGLPSVGKSTLLNKLTHAQSKVAAYDFTTLEVIPGMLDYRGAKIQIFDIPGIIRGAAVGKGRGKEILSVARIADLILLMFDVTSYPQLETTQNELYTVGLRLNQRPPEVAIHKRIKGGIKVISSSLPKETVVEIAKEFRISNAEIILKGQLTEEDLIDALLGNRVYLPFLAVVNKIDLISSEQLSKIESYLVQKNIDSIFLAVERGVGLDKLKEKIWEKLELLRIFLKPQGGKADLENPLIIKNTDTVLAVAQKIHGEMASNIKGAQVWGSSAKFPGQLVSLGHKLQDGDIVTFLMH